MSRPLKVLLLEDNSVDAELLLLELRRAGFAPDCRLVETEADYMASLDPSLDLILSDYGLPGFSGLRALEVLKESGLEIPFILVSGTIGEETAVAAMREGAADYLLKDRLARLGVAINRALDEDRMRRERRQSEELIRESEAALRLFRTLVDQSKDTFEVIDPETGRFLDVTDKSCAELGYTREEHLGLRVFDLDPLTSEESWRAASAQLRETGSLSREGLRLRKDGTTFPTEVNAKWVHLDRDYIVAVVRDIGSRKKAQEMLRETEGRYRTLFDYAPDGILIADPNGFYLDANASICRMLGFTRDELVGSQASRIVMPEESPNIGPAIHVIQTKSHYQREWKFRRKDGSPFPAEVIATMMPDGNMLAMIRDVTERKRSEDRFRRLVESNAQGVMFRKSNGEITDANDAFLNIVGYNRQDLVAGRLNWIDLTPPEYAELDQRCLLELAAHGVCTPYEKEYTRRDGTRVSVLVGAASFEDSPEEGVCFVLDLTERKKLEQQFLRAQRMESIGTLAGGIAHDLNNVLAPIIMSLDLMKMKFTDPASSEMLEMVSSSAQRGADMVSQVLSFARGVEGRRMEIQIKHLIQDIEKIANETFLKHIQVRTIVPHHLWTIIGDPTQLHQVLLNLCVNARDAMPEGGMLTISAENLALDTHYAGMNLEAKPGPYVLLQVEDSGTGMPAEVVEKIFDPFFTTKEIGRGTGLGLSTSLAIVKSHGGFIRVYSEPGVGTRFKVFLPAWTGPLSGTAEEMPPEMPRGNGELILVVDDEASVRQITQQTLEAFGYRVVLASDGADAVAIYATRQAEIAAVLTDMTMPVMDGAAAIQVLRKFNPNVRIIAASGLSSNGYITDAASLGVKHFLAKPYTAETLLKTLAQVLKQD
jgi:PAS domain S-box-containing protein